MASLFDKVAKFARTPRGRRLLDQAGAKAQQLSKDPANRAKVQRLQDEVSRRFGGGNRRPPKG